MFSEKKWADGYIQAALRKYEKYDFRATFKDYGDIQTLDWQKVNGGSDYHVHYVFDTKQECMFITGDLGSACFRLTWEPTFENMHWRRSQVEYLISKIECSTDKYIWPYEAVEQDIRMWYADSRPERENYPDDEDGQTEYEDACEEFDDAIEDLINCYDRRTGAHPDLELEEKLQKIDEDWWDSSFGRCIDPRVHLWFLGLECAWDQLYGNQDREIEKRRKPNEDQTE